MAVSHTEASLRTLLHDWHVGNGARMVVFGGFSMPLNYAEGVVREHLATRTQAGLFDVSHMGRFRASGQGTQDFLSRVLTNDASALASGQAHYTLLANERGGAIDDAYLYRLSAEDFLLVVNASNRARDWDWLHAQSIPDSVRVTDQSEALAMFALQGPRSEALLAELMDASALPQARRNRLRMGKYEGHALIVARTGYTGEAVGFELFVDAQVAAALWQRLVDAGAVPAGLGARDSLRLEAGLPLYGHELGTDRDGAEIPIFANRLARFGVRKPGMGDYVGRRALDAQREEYDAVLAGAIGSSQARRLPRLVQPLAVFDGRRPLRAGYDLLLADEPVGYVTSGTSVPVGCARATEPYRMRPVGLALVRCDIRFDPHTPVHFTVRAARQALMEAQLVERNLPPARMT
ncbi:MAG: glycine cleavage system aminomethyltransferase GcvT [Burkholderiales bacterium]